MHTHTHTHTDTNILYRIALYFRGANILRIGLPQAFRGNNFRGLVLLTTPIRIPQTTSSQTRFRHLHVQTQDSGDHSMLCWQCCLLPYLCFFLREDPPPPPPLAYKPLFLGCMACWASKACLASPLAEAMAVDGTVFESGPRGSGGVVSELLLEVQLEPFSH